MLDLVEEDVVTTTTTKTPKVSLPTVLRRAKGFKDKPCGVALR